MCGFCTYCNIFILIYLPGGVFLVPDDVLADIGKINISPTDDEGTSLLSTSSTPEQRELICTAISVLCKELTRRPAHLWRSEWEDVEGRIRALVRLDKIWAIGATQLGGMNFRGEGREIWLFGEALRDGYVLCQ
jgi:hypothetical protein